MFLFYNPDEKWNKLLSLKMGRRSVFDESTKQKVDVQVTTSVSRVNKKCWFNKKKKKTYLSINIIVHYGDDIKFYNKLIKL